VDTILNSAAQQVVARIHPPINQRCGIFRGPAIVEEYLLRHAAAGFHVAW
jgi:hypothetical protein